MAFKDDVQARISKLEEAKQSLTDAYDAKITAYDEEIATLQKVSKKLTKGVEEVIRLLNVHFPE